MAMAARVESPTRDDPSAGISPCATPWSSWIVCSARQLPCGPGTDKMTGAAEHPALVSLVRHPARDRNRRVARRNAMRVFLILFFLIRIG
jgi:hypothetical protein